MSEEWLSVVGRDGVMIVKGHTEFAGAGEVLLCNLDGSFTLQ